MRFELRPSTAVALLFVVIAVVAGGSVVAAAFGVEGETDGSAPETVTLDDGTELWPYTSGGPNYHERTLSINLVVYGDADATESILRESSVGDWDELDEERADIAPVEEFEIDTNETSVAWGGADGANRYVHIDPPNDEEIWLVESYQLSNGDYLGDRRHIRAYVDTVDAEWTALQSHDEHWDWFHLRHTVHGIEQSQLAVEEEFVDRWYVEELRRERFGNDDSSDANGWVTVVDIDDGIVRLLLTGVLVGSFGASRSVGRDDIATWWADDSVQSTVRSLLVVGVLVSLYAVIRFGALGIERNVTALNPKFIVAVFYPALIVGFPVAAYLLTRQLSRPEAFTAAALGFIVAIFLDYTYLGVATLPLDTVIHRGALGVGIGLIAAGASQTAREPGVELGHVRTGALLWVVAAALPLLQFV